MQRPFPIFEAAAKRDAAAADRDAASPKRAAEERALRKAMRRRARQKARDTRRLAGSIPSGGKDGGGASDRGPAMNIALHMAWEHKEPAVALCWSGRTLFTSDTTGKCLGFKLEHSAPVFTLVYEHTRAALPSDARRARLMD
jgi:hypothetical protein